MKVLIVAAHPDDEVLGVGGTILRHKACGDEVYVCVMTKAFAPSWTKEYMATKLLEQKKVDKLLGIKKRFNLDLLTTQLNSIPHGELNRKINAVIEKINPQIVYTHFEYDLNYDHTLTYRACMVSCRPPKRIKLLCFETLSESEWNNKTLVPNYWVEIGRFIEKKIKAFKIYRSEVKNVPHPRSEEGLRALARKRGGEICVEYAEAFMLVKDSWC